MNPLTEQLLQHDLDDTARLLELAKGLSAEEFVRHRLPGNVVVSWEGEERSIAEVLEHHVFTKECWLASIEGTEFPTRPEQYDAIDLIDRHDAAAPRWLAVVRDIDRRGGWEDRLIDALCDPPESFVISSVVAHVITYAAHRRQLARHLLRDAGVDVDSGDPIMWLRVRRGEEQQEEQAQEENA